MSRKGRRGAKRSYRWLVVPVLVLVTAAVGYYIFTQSGTIGQTSPSNNKPVSQTDLAYLSGVSSNTLSQIGAGSANSPTPIANGPALTANGKPEILYMGAEYCPFCGAQRWAMIVALDKFGSFTGLQYMQSSAADIDASTSTFTFVNATYTSDYITFVSVEQTDRNQQALQTATSAESSLLSTYDTGGTIPFVDFANKYMITSSMYSPNVLHVGNTATGAPYNWTSIASQLDNPSSIFAQNIDAAANKMISAICKVDGGQPASVCTQSYATLLSYTAQTTQAAAQLLISDVLPASAPTRPSHL